MQWGDTQKGFNNTFREVSPCILLFMLLISLQLLLHPLQTTIGRAALQDDLNQVFKAALAGGINFFDTAEVALPSQHDTAFVDALPFLDVLI